MLSYCHSGRIDPIHIFWLSAFETTSCCREFSLLAVTKMRRVTEEKGSEGTLAASLCNVCSA